MSDEKQVTTYVVMKDVKGKDVYKKRVISKERRLKERSDSYYERKEKAIQDRIARLNDEYKLISQKSLDQHNDLFSKFAQDYTKTLDRLISQSRQYRLNKAKMRRGGRDKEEPDPRDVIRGRHARQQLLRFRLGTPERNRIIARLKEELKR